MMEQLVITVPGSVPSKGNLYRVSRRGGLYSTGEVHDFSALVARVMIDAALVPLKGDVDVTVWVYSANDRRDIAGCEKALLDALQNWRRGSRGKRIPIRHGCYQNDKQVRRFLVEWGGIDKKNPRCEVIVKAYSPESRSVPE